VHTQVVAELKRKHLIRAQLLGSLPPLPESFNGHVTLLASQNGDLTIETPGELSGLLGWLATLPLAEVRIEPLGLAALYDQYHVS
jgi:ABC-2 type transport system ATP-binding protein